MSRGSRGADEEEGRCASESMNQLEPFFIKDGKRLPTQDSQPEGSKRVDRLVKYSPGAAVMHVTAECTLSKSLELQYSTVSQVISV